jgi:enoyl-CoA hydratase
VAQQHEPEVPGRDRVPGSTDELLCEIDRHVAYVTINREHRLNALGRDVRERFPELMSFLADSPRVWAVVIRGAGRRAFSTGNDLKELNAAAQDGRSPDTPMTGPYRNIFESVLEIPKPTIASIGGYAIAGGFELALACDLRVASGSSVFGMPEAKIGMGANFASVVLPRLIGRGAALELLYTGKQIDARRAFELGLLVEVVGDDLLEEATERLVRSIVRNAPLTLRRYKEMTSKGWELPVPVALRLNVGPNPYASQDREEGIRAFLEKREPRWTGQ